MWVYYMWWVFPLCSACIAVGMYFGYWLRKRDEADGVVSALKTALDERRVPEAVRQQVLVSSPTAQLLTLAHWEPMHNGKVGKGKPEDYKRCRSIASRIMLIKPLE